MTEQTVVDSDILDPMRIAKLLWQCYSTSLQDNSPTLIRALLPSQGVSQLRQQWKADETEFSVALAQGAVLTRTRDLHEAAKLYRSHPRTRLFESVHTRSGEWQSVVAALLSSWIGSDVLSSVYEAERADSTLPEHCDAWHNIVLQLVGSKRWSFDGIDVVIEAGDVLVVPTGVMHYVKTDRYSVHINFEVIDPQIVHRYMTTSTSSPNTQTSEM